MPVQWSIRKTLRDSAPQPTPELPLRSHPFGSGPGRVTKARVGFLLDCTIPRESSNSCVRRERGGLELKSDPWAFAESLHAGPCYPHVPSLKQNGFRPIEDSATQPSQRGSLAWTADRRRPDTCSPCCTCHICKGRRCAIIAQPREACIRIPRDVDNLISCY